MMMNVVPIIGLSLVLVDFILLVLIHLNVKRNIKYALSRLFLKREDAVRAFASLIVGILSLSMTGIAKLLYALNVVRYQMYSILAAVIGMVFSLCLVYAFYKLYSIVRIRKS